MSVRQSVFNDDFRQNILAVTEGERERTELFVDDLTVDSGANEVKSVGFDKNGTGRVQIKFSCWGVGRVKIRLLLDDVVFVERYVANVDGFKSVTVDKSLFVTAGRHALTLSVDGINGGSSVKNASFLLVGSGVKAAFNPYVWYEFANGNDYLIERSGEDFYLLKNTTDKADGVKITFSDQPTPQKIKLKHYGDNCYALFKTDEGTWNMAEFDENGAKVGKSVELVRASDCDFSFKGADCGELYFVAVGELYRAVVGSVFTAKTQSAPIKLVFEEIKQKVRGVYVSPDEFESTANYLVVWGTGGVVAAKTAKTGSEYLTEVLAVVNEPNCRCAYAVDGFFCFGGIKNGLFTGRELRAADDGTTVTVTKKRYCCADVAAAFNVDGFVLYDDGKYIFI